MQSQTHGALRNCMGEFSRVALAITFKTSIALARARHGRPTGAATKPRAAAHAFLGVRAHLVLGCIVRGGGGRATVVPCACTNTRFTFMLVLICVPRGARAAPERRCAASDRIRRPCGGGKDDAGGQRCKVGGPQSHKVRQNSRQQPTAAVLHRNGEANLWLRSSRKNDALGRPATGLIQPNTSLWWQNKDHQICAVVRLHRQPPVRTRSARRQSPRHSPTRCARGLALATICSALPSACRSTSNNPGA